MKIQGISDSRMYFTSRAYFDLVIFEFGKRYSFSFELIEEEDDELLVEFDELGADFIRESEIAQSYYDIIEKFDCDRQYETSRIEICNWLQTNINEGNIELEGLEIFEEDEGSYYLFQGRNEEITVQLRVYDEDNSCDDTLRDEIFVGRENYYDLGDEEFEYEDFVYSYCDFLKISFGGDFILHYEGKECDEIRDLLSIEMKPVIDIEDFIVRISLFQCINRDHHLNKVGALVYIDDGEKVFKYTANALYCPECDQYFITESELARLCDMGRLCCGVITLNEYSEINKNGYDRWAKRSLLNSIGYEVNVKRNLSDKERQRILSFAIENNIISISEAIDFLSWLVARPTAKGKNMDNARRKWQRDIEYLQNYVPASNVVIVRNMYRKARSY